MQNTCIVQADLHRNGFLAAFDLDSGKELWRTPRQDLSSWATPNVIRSAAGEELVVNATYVTASLLAADGRIFVFTEDGTALVLSSGPEPALLGTYSVGEPVMATPAISGGLLVVRTLDHVIGIDSGTGR